MLPPQLLAALLSARPQPSRWHDSDLALCSPCSPSGCLQPHGRPCPSQPVLAAGPARWAMPSSSAKCLARRFLSSCHQKSLFSWREPFHRGHAGQWQGSTALQGLVLGSGHLWAGAGGVRRTAQATHPLHGSHTSQRNPLLRQWKTGAET